MNRAGCTCPLKKMRDGREALEYLAGAGAFGNRTEHPLPRLIFLDMKLPLVSGVEVLIWLDKRPELSLPLIVLTASTDEAEKRRALQMGVAAYLPKPPSPDLIQKLVERYRLYECDENQPAPAAALDSKE